MCLVVWIQIVVILPLPVDIKHEDFPMLSVFTSRVSNRLVSAHKPFDYAEFALEIPSIAHEDGEESGNLFPACLTSHRF